MQVEQKEFLSSHTVTGITRFDTTITGISEGVSQHLNDYTSDGHVFESDTPVQLTETPVLDDTIATMKKQIGLLQAFDELLENTKDFRDALSDLLKLYVDNYSRLTKVQQGVIEEITECTAKIDIGNETEVWRQCITKMEKHYIRVKEALYSQDIKKMKENQNIFKLADSKKKEAAKKWIEYREQVVQTGRDSLSRLKEMCNRDDALSTDVCDTFEKRVKVGDCCLKAWRNWIEQRIKLDDPLHI